jgi:hypothetical protein
MIFGLKSIPYKNEICKLQFIMVKQEFRRFYRHIRFRIMDMHGILYPIMNLVFFVCMML